MKGTIPEIERLAIEPPGYRMKYYRLQNGLTQKELAKKCGLTESAIRNYELGNRSPSDIHRAQIADALKVSVHAIGEPDISLVYGALHVLFDMEKTYGIVPEVIDGKSYIAIPGSKKKSSGADLLSRMVRTWEKMRTQLDAGKIDLETYVEWQSKYPEQIEEIKKQENKKNKH